jgi:hypothetical protein
MKCFSGVDVLNAVLRKVTIIQVDKGGRNVTESILQREHRYLGKGLLPRNKADLDLFRASSEIVTCS